MAARVLRTTAGRTRRPEQGLRPVQILEGYEVVTELDARNLPDALRRFQASRPWLRRPLVTGNTLTVEDEDGSDRTFHAKDMT